MQKLKGFVVARLVNVEQAAELFRLVFLGASV